MRNIRCEVRGEFVGAGRLKRLDGVGEEGPACAVKTINTWKNEVVETMIRHEKKVLVGALVRKWPVVRARESGGDRKERALAWYGSGCLPLRS